VTVVAQALGEQEFRDILACRLFVAPTVESFGKTIPVEDLTNPIGGDDRLLHSREQHGQEPQALSG
jgi:hypothetical protein